MEPIETKKYTKYTLEFIFTEADTLAVQILNSISETRNRSFFLLALLAPLFSYAFLKTTEKQYEYSILWVGCLIALYFLRKNLVPSIISLNGALPENMIDSHFDSFEKEKLEKEYLATQIQSYNQAIKKNKDETTNMAERFKESIIALLVIFVIFGVVFLIQSIEYFPT